MIKKYFLAVSALILGLIVLQGCNSILMKKQQTNRENMTGFQYKFTDSSVPPPYHRSYVIDIDSDTIHVVVNSYGDILADTTFEAPAEALDTINNLLIQHKIVIKKQSSKDNAGCTGGTTQSIAYTAQDSLLQTGSVYYCGGNAYGNVVGDFKKFGEDFRATLVPQLGGIIAKTTSASEK